MFKFYQILANDWQIKYFKSENSIIEICMLSSRIKLTLPLLMGVTCQFLLINIWIVSTCYLSNISDTQMRSFYFIYTQSIYLSREELASMSPTCIVHFDYYMKYLASSRKWFIVSILYVHLHCTSPDEFELERSTRFWMVIRQGKHKMAYMLDIISNFLVMYHWALRPKLSR